MPRPVVARRQRAQVAALRRQHPNRAVTGWPILRRLGTAGLIAHDNQTEGYLIVSGGGTLMTGGRLVNGRHSLSLDLERARTCGGTTIGDITKKVVKTGDIIIIPAGVPHGWTDIGDHVDYLSFRPSPNILTAGYVHPTISKK